MSVSEGDEMVEVRRAIERFRGHVEYKAEKDRGAVFRIYLPVTLAIIEGIVVRCGLERYVIPISAVVEFMEFAPAQRDQIFDRDEMFRVHGRLVRLLRLSSLFNLHQRGHHAGEGVVCILESDQGAMALLVDELLGQQQVVIKSLGMDVQRVPGISGAAILGDGKAALIIDVNGLLARSA